MWKGELGEAGVWYGAAAEIRVVSVTSLLAWAVTISANVNKLAASVGYDLVAPKPFSQVAISGSGRISISGSLTTSGATLISRPSRARDLVTMDEVGSGRVPSLERVTTGVGSATGAETKKLDSLGTSSRPSWLGLSLSIALLSNTRFTVKKYRNLLVPIYLYGKFGFYYNTKRYTLYRPFSNGDGRRNEAKQLLQ